VQAAFRERVRRHAPHWSGASHFEAAFCGTRFIGEAQAMKRFRGWLIRKREELECRCRRRPQRLLEWFDFSWWTILWWFVRILLLFV
jgi:hypothetical protein